MKVTNKVIIIGGGIAGASAGLFLKRLNFEVEIYEAYEKERISEEDCKLLQME